MPGKPEFGFTNIAPTIARALVSEVVISSAFNPSLINPKDHPSRNKFLAIWDTGATGTVITDNVVNRCGLKPTGMVRVQTASGIEDTETFIINLELPNKVGVQDLKVTKGKLQGLDVLIGMDIITLGDLAISNFQGKTAFTFRIPSREFIDFKPSNAPIKKEAQVGRNDPCPCGSKKKFKKCCGK